MAQVAEHVLGKDEVTGSNPVNSSKEKPVDTVFTVFAGFSILFLKCWNSAKII